MEEPRTVRDQRFTRRDSRRFDEKMRRDFDGFTCGVKPC